MSTHGVPSRGDTGVALPAVVPFDVPHLSRLSWELGTRVVGDDESTLRGQWDHAESLWKLSIFRVTSATVVIRVRTPAGRKRFYSTAECDLPAVVPAVESASEWRRLA